MAGTADPFRRVSRPVKGQLDVLHKSTVVFTGVENSLDGQTLSIPFDAITGIELGEKPGPKASSVIAATALLGVAGFIVSTRGPTDQYLTLQYHDSGAAHTAVFLLPSEFAEGIVKALEERSGVRRGQPAVIEAAVPSAAPPAFSDTTRAPERAAPPPSAVRAPEMLTNDDVVAMHRAGLSDDLVLLKIKESRPAFDTSAQGLIRLKQAGLSNSVIAAMLTTK